MYFIRMVEYGQHRFARLLVSSRSSVRSRHRLHNIYTIGHCQWTATSFHALLFALGPDPWPATSARPSYGRKGERRSRLGCQWGTYQIPATRVFEVFCSICDLTWPRPSTNRHARKKTDRSLYLIKTQPQQVCHHERVRPSLRPLPLVSGTGFCVQLPCH
jgi:hypothetical protein